MKRIIIVLMLFAVVTCNSQEKRAFRPILQSGVLPSRIVKTAKLWNGKYFRKGQSCQCANWISEVVHSAGGGRPLYSSMARNWLKWGKGVSKSAMKPGDVIVTWRGSKTGKSGHVLIYLGNGKCIHRPTRSKPVQLTELSFYKSKIIGVRRAI